MCHVVLLLPLLTLPVFWILPFALALPVYGMLVAVSAAIYWYALLAMRRPAQMGAEGMVGQIGVVIESSGNTLIVRAHSELWQASCSAHLREGDRVRAVAVENLTLRVRKLESNLNREIPSLATLRTVTARSGCSADGRST